MLPTGLYGVGKAAVHPPALAVLSHTPEGATQTIAWVGKGIVYDTGGLSIKGKVRRWALLRRAPACGAQGSSSALGRWSEVTRLLGARSWGPPLGAGFRESVREADSPSERVDLVPTLSTGTWKQKNRGGSRKKAAEMTKGQENRAHGGRVQGVRWPPVSTTVGFQGGTPQGRSYGLQVPCTKEREPGAGGKPPGSMAVRVKSQKSLLWVAFEVRMSQDDAYLRKASPCPHRSPSERPAPPHTQLVRGLLGTGSSDGPRSRSEVSSSAHPTLACGAAPEYQARAGLPWAKAGRRLEGADM